MYNHWKLIFIKMAQKNLTTTMMGKMEKIDNTFTQ